MITIGIDPGLSGAIGVLRNGAFVTVLDMPIVAKGSGSVKNEVDPAGALGKTPRRTRRWPWRLSG
jgi:hypothetical protein